ncbi:MAG TPA: DUF4389 domain-containing protein [Hyphomicrobiaceae bacterium]
MMSIERPDETMHPRDAWKRGLFMLLFAIAFGISHVVLNVVAIVQFLWLLFTGAPNRFLARFGQSFSSWLAETARFVTCASDDKPFPWQQWPDAG